MTEPLATIIIPTIDLKQACKTAKLAQKTAGCSVSIVVACDGARRGSTITGNAGMAAAQGFETPYIAYVNDDARPEQQGWLARLIEALEEDPSYAIAVPGGPCRTNPQAKAKPGMPRGVQVVKEISLFCGVMKASVIRGMVFWDPIFTHYGNDSDFRRRVQQLGYKCVWVRDVYVHHELADYIPDWKDDDKRAYKERWG